MRLRLFATASSLLCGAAGAAPAQTPAPSAAQPADLIVTNARIYTVDDGRPLAEAMAIRGGRVQFAGSERGALTMRGPQTRILDAADATIIPGIADAHVHLLNLGLALRTVSLVGARSYEEVVARIAAKARELRPAPGSPVAAGTRTTGRTRAFRRTTRSRAQSRTTPCPSRAWMAMPRS